MVVESMAIPIRFLGDVDGTGSISSNFLKHSYNQINEELQCMTHKCSVTSPSTYFISYCNRNLIFDNLSNIIHYVRF